MHIPDPVQPPNPPVHVSNPIQPQNPQVHVPDPMQPQNPPVHVPNPTPTVQKIDRQLSGQSGTITPFMKVGDIHHSKRTVSFNMHDPIREQSESLTSMAYNMSVHKEDNNRPFKPQIHQKKRRG